MSDKVLKLIEDVKALTVMELSELVKALEEAKLIEQQFSSLDEMMQELSSGESRGKQQASKMS